MQRGASEEYAMQQIFTLTAHSVPDEEVQLLAPVADHPPKQLGVHVVNRSGSRASLRHSRRP